MREEDDLDRHEKTLSDEERYDMERLGEIPVPMRTPIRCLWFGWHRFTFGFRRRLGGRQYKRYDYCIHCGEIRSYPERN